MYKIKMILGIMLALQSAYMVVAGSDVFFQTLGRVQGSEFGMLITLVNQLSLFMVWASLFALWRLVPSGSLPPSAANAEEMNS